MGQTGEESTIRVTYHANQSTGGSVPVDINTYELSDEITVLGNSGSLVKTEHSFDGWNTKQDGSGTDYGDGETFIIGNQTINLYAQWAAINGIRALAAGGDGFSYILQTDGSLWTTGFNGYGQLGNGTNDSSVTAEIIMQDVKAISAGPSFAMILKENGDLYATGDNNQGQLGTGDKINVSTPVHVKTDTTFSAVDCGYYHTMAIAEDGTLWGAGANGVSGVLGNNSQHESLNFIQISVPGDAKVISVSAGERHTLFATEDGKLYGMGDKGQGKLIRPKNDPGFSGTIDYIREPYLLSTELINVRSVSAGENHSMVVTKDNELYAFGSQRYGELGNGVSNVDTTNSGIFTPFKVTHPLLVDNGDDIVQEVFAGEDTTLILRTDGTLLAVGSDYSHMLGDGNDSTAHHLEIFEVAENVNSIALSGSHTLYGDTDGTVRGAGFNHGGPNTTTTTSALGQGSPSDKVYKIFVEIPLIEVAD